MCDEFRHCSRPLPASPNFGGGAGSRDVKLREEGINSRNDFPPGLGGREAACGEAGGRGRLGRTIRALLNITPDSSI